MELAYFSKDVAAMSRFYQRLLGTNPVAESDGMVIFMVGDTKIFIHRTYQPGEGELPPENHIALAVADLDEACRQLVERGLTLEVPPKEYYWGDSAYLRDPDGHLIELNQAPREA